MNLNFKKIFRRQRSISHREENLVKGQVQPESQPCLPLPPHKCRLAWQALRCRPGGDRAGVREGLSPARGLLLQLHTVSTPSSTSPPWMPQVPEALFCGSPELESCLTPSGHWGHLDPICGLPSWIPSPCHKLPAVEAVIGHADYPPPAPPPPHCLFF